VRKFYESASLSPSLASGGCLSCPVRKNQSVGMLQALKLCQLPYQLLTCSLTAAAAAAAWWKGKPINAGVCLDYCNAVLFCCTAVGYRQQLQRRHADSYTAGLSTFCFICS